MTLIKGNEIGSGEAKGTRELNQHIEAEKKGGRGGVTGEGRVLLEDDELRIIDHSENANSRRSLSSVQLPESHRTHSQVQSLGRVCWERFLPVGSPKVLLVESDDSTRHVVTALLRNCSYEVIAVSNGSEAWKILEDLTNQIDLVLTEVVTSGLSGIGLLSKIMSHKSCQNIPVIMMSTHDSMGIVLKCLSKGAADYLVKPIRKNELKNLWQHVWRRCHSSSGSGSESCIRNENRTGTKCAEELGNDTDCDSEDDNRSISLQARDGSDNGSGTQSSWTKRAAEVESPQRLSASDQATEPSNSTCAQVIYPMPEAFASSWMLGASKEHGKQDNQLDNISMGKDLEIGVPKNTDALQNAPNKTTTSENNKCSLLDLNLKNDGQSCDDEDMEMSNDNPKGEWIKQDMNLPREVPGNNEHHQGNMLPDEPPLLAEISKTKDKAEQHAVDLPSLELSLKRLGDDQNILGHSQVSAFTRYKTGSTGNQGQTTDVGSCSPPNNSSEAAKQSNSDPPNQISNSSSNNNKGSTTNRSFTKPALPADKAPGTSAVNCSHNPSVFQPVQSGHKVNAGSINAALQENDTGNQQIKIQHHHHHHHHHNVHSVQKLQNLPAQDEISKSMDRNGTETLQCGSSNNSRPPTLANVANCSLNGSASGSNNGSNFINGSSAVVNAEGTNLVDDSGIAAKDGGVDNGNGSGSGSGSGIGVDHNRSAQREAALNKFRLKRKERCFDKRVRYQSRKKLADQRPRVRGQFVRHRPVQENKGKMQIANLDSSNCCPDYYGTSNMPL